MKYATIAPTIVAAVMLSAGMARELRSQTFEVPEPPTESQCSSYANYAAKIERLHLEGVGVADLLRTVLDYEIDERPPFWHSNLMRKIITIIASEPTPRDGWTLTVLKSCFDQGW